MREELLGGGRGNGNKRWIVGAGGVFRCELDKVNFEVHTLRYTHDAL